MLKEALDIAARLNDEAREHSLRVGRKAFAGRDDSPEVLVALLHDTVEDRVATIDEIRAKFGDVVADAVDAITRRPNESYLFHYVWRVAGNDIARAVKILDLSDNLARGFYPAPANRDAETKMILEAGGVPIENPEAPSYTLARRYAAALAILQSWPPKDADDA